MTKQIENHIEENLTGQLKQVALDFVAFLRKNNVEFYRDICDCWKDKLYNCCVQIKTKRNDSLIIKMLHIHVDMPKLHFGLITQFAVIFTYFTSVFGINVARRIGADKFLFKLVLGQVFDKEIASKGRTIFGSIIGNTV